MYNCNYHNMGMAIPNIAPEKKFNLTIEVTVKRTFLN